MWWTSYGGQCSGNRCHYPEIAAAWAPDRLEVTLEISGLEPGIRKNFEESSHKGGAIETLLVGKEVDFMRTVISLHRDDHLPESLEHFGGLNWVGATFREGFDFSLHIHVHPHEPIQLRLERLFDEQTSAQRHHPHQHSALSLVGDDAGREHTGFGPHN